MSTLFDLIQDEVKAGRVREHTDGDLVLYKYTETCAFNKEWNEVNRKCRGLVFHKPTKKQLTYPFPKFFNLGEMPESSLNNLPNASYEVWDKVDGSACFGFIDPSTGKWRLATPGGLTSDQAKKGTELLEKYNLSALEPTDCPIFEVVYPEDRKVVDYKGFTGLILLTIFDHNWEELGTDQIDEVAHRCGFIRPIRYGMLDFKNPKFHDNAEGYVVRFANGLRIKIKSPIYVQIHKMLEYVNPSRVLELVRGVGDISLEEVVNSIPESLRSSLDDILAQLKAKYQSMQSLASDFYEKLKAQNFESRKDKALWIQENVPQNIRSLIFSLLDGKDITDQTWRIIEKELDTIFKENNNENCNMP